MTEPRLLGGRYELDGVVGRGGMAEVFQGRDVRLDRQVAVKTLRADLARDPTFQARFRREAQSCASLNHPSIIAVYDTGEGAVQGNTVPYIVMEYVAGRTLRDMLQDDRQILPERGLEVMDGVLRALEYSHGSGIVHRDIKPANIMVTTSREIKVMDFGIARAVHDTTSTMTQTAQVIGTAQYLSPEQARGERVDARSDLYSTGCVLYEVLTGVPPFRGDSPVAIAYQHVREEPIPPSQVDPATPRWADSIVLKAMSKDADNRYQSAAEMRADVQRALVGQEVTAPVTATQHLAAGPANGSTRALPRNGGEPSDGRRRRQRSPWVWIAPLLILALALAGAGGWLLTRGLRDSGPPQVQVPRVIGMSEKGARSTLRNENLKVRVSRDFTNKVDPGDVFNQQPPAGRRIAAGSVVTIFVSKGRATVGVPSVVGESRSSAVAAMERRGLTTTITEKPSDRPEGTVMKTRPAGGERVKRGSQVELVVSSGPATKQVPSVLGKQVGEARSTLRQQGFQVDVTYRTNTGREPGTVFEQTPDGGTRVKKGSSVTIFVAQAPEETQEPSPSPSSSPSDGQGDDIFGWGRSDSSEPPGFEQRRE